MTAEFLLFIQSLLRLVVSRSLELSGHAAFDSPAPSVKSLRAFLRLTGLLFGTLLVFGFGVVPFVFGAVAQTLSPRHLRPSITSLLGTTAFLVAWLALDNVPFAFLRPADASRWPSLVAGRLFSMASCAYVAFLVRGLWPQRFASSSSATSLSPTGEDGRPAGTESVPPVSAAKVKPWATRIYGPL